MENLKHSLKQTSEEIWNLSTDTSQNFLVQSFAL